MFQVFNLKFRDICSCQKLSNYAILLTERLNVLKWKGSKILEKFIPIGIEFQLTNRGTLVWVTIFVDKKSNKILYSRTEIFEKNL